MHVRKAIVGVVAYFAVAACLILFPSFENTAAYSAYFASHATIVGALAVVFVGANVVQDRLKPFLERLAGVRDERVRPYIEQLRDQLESTVVQNNYVVYKGLVAYLQVATHKDVLRLLQFVAEATRLVSENPPERPSTELLFRGDRPDWIVRERPGQVLFQDVTLGNNHITAMPSVQSIRILVTNHVFDAHFETTYEDSFILPLQSLKLLNSWLM